MIGWIDVETTGADPVTYALLEVSFVITDDDLNILRSCSVVIAPPTPLAIQAGIEDMHVVSGLLREAHERGLPMAHAERMLCDVYGDAPTGRTTGMPMGGISLWLDRMFLRHYMPRFLGMFHYRNVDLTTVREFAKRWRPDLVEREPGKGVQAPHRGEADIHAALEIARFYRRELFDLRSVAVPADPPVLRGNQVVS